MCEVGLVWGGRVQGESVDAPIELSETCSAHLDAHLRSMRELVHGSGRQARRHPLGGLAEQGKLPWRQSSNVVRELARLVVRSEVSEKVMLREKT